MFIEVTVQTAGGAVVGKRILNTRQIRGVGRDVGSGRVAVIIDDEELPLFVDESYAAFDEALAVKHVDKIERRLRLESAAAKAGVKVDDSLPLDKLG